MWDQWGWHRVTVYERMASPARKFLLAGRGGLNLTHSEPFDAFLRRYREAQPRLEPALRAFPPHVDAFTASHGRNHSKTSKSDTELHR